MTCLQCGQKLSMLRRFSVDRLCHGLSALAAKTDESYHSAKHEDCSVTGWHVYSAEGPDCRRGVATTAFGLFEEQAARTPNATALVCGSQSLSYRQLNERANRLANCLIRRGIGSEDVVALATPRSPEMIVGLLGILKAGAAYLPLEPESPPQRLALILEDAAPQCIITTESAAAILPDGLQRLVLDADDTVATLAGCSPGNPDEDGRKRPLLPLNAAYIIYTSGSTGTPKGVIVDHAGLMNYLSWACRFYESDQGQGAPLNTPLVFDATVTSLYLPLISGKRLFLLPEERQIEALAELLASGVDLTLVKLTPAHLRALQSLLGARASAVRARRFVVGGEALHESVAGFWREHAPGVRIINEYGPTEAVVGCSVYEVGPQADPSGSVPIGKATPNTRLYVLDADLRPLPVGVTGELYIGGRQLARGYWKNPALTAERFVVDPFTGPEARMYRSGDLVRRRADGNLEFLGRKDHQVKIRGFRIELGEIEAALTQCPAVEGAVVTVRRISEGRNQLIAHVVPAGTEKPGPGQLRDFLKRRLPEYMIPSRFIAMDALPLTDNGKVNRQALAAAEWPEHDHQSGYLAPRTNAEKAVAGIFADLLGHARIGARDHFFDLGGDSLSAVTLLARLEERFGARIPTPQLLSGPTVEELAALMDTGQESFGGSLTPFRRTGSQAPLFCVHGLGGGVIVFRELAKSLGLEQPFYGLQAVGIDDDGAPHVRVEDMAAHYIQQIREVQPDGPYHLGGWSFGGCVAFEIARQLVAAEETVALLALLDSLAPSSIRLNGLGYFLSRNAQSLLKGAWAHLREWTRAASGSKLTYVANLLKRRMETATFEAQHKRYERGGAVPQQYNDIGRAQMTAWKRYRAKTYPGNAVLFRSEENRSAYSRHPALGWEGLILGGLQMQDVPGDHNAMLVQPHVNTLAEKLRASMQAASGVRDRK